MNQQEYDAWCAEIDLCENYKRLQAIATYMRNEEWRYLRDHVSGVWREVTDEAQYHAQLYTRANERRAHLLDQP